MPSLFMHVSGYTYVCFLLAVYLGGNCWLEEYGMFSLTILSKQFSKVVISIYTPTCSIEFQLLGILTKHQHCLFQVIVIGYSGITVYFNLHFSVF